MSSWGLHPTDGEPAYIDGFSGVFACGSLAKREGSAWSKQSIEKSDTLGTRFPAIEDMRAVLGADRPGTVVIDRPEC